jgi:hypothetical protein
MNSQPSIHLHIEALVLDGFAPGDRHDIAAAVEAELIRLMSAPAVSAGLSANLSRDRIDGGSFRLAKAAKPAAVGVQIAGAVYGGINR